MKLFPQLEILSLLGAGGMGAVYKARQPALDRLVALKIVPSGEDKDRFSERFNREARALARLSHPNIVAVHEFGQAGKISYFIMEFVDGTNLRQLECAGRLAPREVLQVIPQICDALQYAHDEGVVHRDIKPENVLLDRKGRVKIADFGLAKILGQNPESARLTAEGQVMGTPHYMAPEQVQHPLTVDHRADIYSLGVVFYEMLTGDLPLGKFSPPSRKVQVDVRLDEVVLRALENDPSRRYQKASEVKSNVEIINTTSGPSSEASQEAAQQKVYWWNFVIGTEQGGRRELSRGGLLKAWAIIFGISTLAFALVTAVTGRSLFGVVGIAGWQSLAMRMLLSAGLVAWGASQAMQRPAAAAASADRVARRNWWVRHWRTVLFGYLCVLGLIWVQFHWLVPRLRDRFFRPVYKADAVAQLDAASGALVGQLPSGATVELIGLSDPATGSNTWWTPGGQRSQNFQSSPPLNETGVASLWRDLLFRLDALPNGSGTPTIQFIPPIHSMRSDITVTTVGQRLAGERLWPWRVSFLELSPTTTIRVGIGTGKWRIIATHTLRDHSTRISGAMGDPQWKTEFNQIQDNGAGAQVTLTLENITEDWMPRLVAVDSNGAEHEETTAPPKQDAKRLHLEESLKAARQEFLSLLSRYTENHPLIIQKQAQINALENQIKRLEVENLRNEPDDGAKTFSEASPDRPQSGVWMTPKENSFAWTFTFPGLGLANIKEFRVQVEPVKWLEFRDVSLQAPAFPAQVPKAATNSEPK